MPRGWPAWPHLPLLPRRDWSCEPRDAHAAHVLRLAQCRLLEVFVRRRARICEDRRLQPVLARVESGLDDAALGRRADDDHALGGLRLEQQLERGVVEGGVAVLEQDVVAGSGEEPLDDLSIRPVRGRAGDCRCVAVPAVSVVVDVTLAPPRGAATGSSLARG
jgi:hypothetical protein